MGIPLELKISGDANVHHHVHLHADGTCDQSTRLLARIVDMMELVVSTLSQLHTKVETMDQDVQDNVAATAAMSDVVNKLPQLVNDFEARITALVKQSPTMTDVDRKALQQATATLRTDVQTALAAFADASDNTDEADTGAGGGTGTGGGDTGTGTGTGGDTGTGTTGGDTGTGGPAGGPAGTGDGTVDPMTLRGGDPLASNR